jgi:hypothetical protein
MLMAFLCIFRIFRPKQKTTQLGAEKYVANTRSAIQSAILEPPTGLARRNAPTTSLPTIVASELAGHFVLGTFMIQSMRRVVQDRLQQASVLKQPEHAALFAIPLPDPAPDEVIRTPGALLAAGTCVLIGTGIYLCSDGGFGLTNTTKQFDWEIAGFSNPANAIST